MESLKNPFEQLSPSAGGVRVEKNLLGKQGSVYARRLKQRLGQTARETPRSKNILDDIELTEAEYTRLELMRQIRDIVACAEELVYSAKEEGDAISIPDAIELIRTQLLAHQSIDQHFLDELQEKIETTENDYAIEWLRTYLEDEALPPAIAHLVAMGLQKNLGSSDVLLEITLLWRSQTPLTVEKALGLRYASEVLGARQEYKCLLLLIKSLERNGENVESFIERILELFYKERDGLGMNIEPLEDVLVRNKKYEQLLDLALSSNYPTPSLGMCERLINDVRIPQEVKARLVEKLKKMPFISGKDRHEKRCLVSIAEATQMGASMPDFKGLIQEISTLPEYVRTDRYLLVMEAQIAWGQRRAAKELAEQVRTLAHESMHEDPIMGAEMRFKLANFVHHHMAEEQVELDVLKIKDAMSKSCLYGRVVNLRQDMAGFFAAVHPEQVAEQVRLITQTFVDWQAAIRAGTRHPRQVEMDQQARVDTRKLLRYLGEAALNLSRRANQV